MNIPMLNESETPRMLKSGGRRFAIGVLLCFALGAGGRAAEGAAAAKLSTGDLILFYGAGMVERLLEEGFLEAQVQLAHPGRQLKVRSLAWTGDEVGHRLRPEGYVEHMKSLLAAWPAKVVVLGYGMNESFAGLGGVERFRTQYETYLRELARRHPGAALVLLSPIAAGDHPGTNTVGRNRELAAYSKVVADLARKHRAQFVELFAASREAYARSPEPLTAQGLHLTSAGAREIGRLIAAALTGAAPIAAGTAREAAVAMAAAQKHRYNAELARPKNGVLYYGVRHRAEENAAEIPRYHRLVEMGDGILHDLVERPDRPLANVPPPSLPPLPPSPMKDYKFASGTVKPPQEMLGDLTVANGYAVNVFASEEQFPELRNPLQMAFDARGRLWVVTMPSFPHTVPGEQPGDKVLILEDTNRDGRADTCTVFAGGFDALDGLAFHERGVIVSEQPRLLLLADTDGNGTADTRTELLRGIDVTDSHHGGMVATDPLGYVIFCDGVFHRSQFETPFGVVRGIDATTYRLDPASGRIGLEMQNMTPNPWKVAFDSYGNLFQRFGGGHVLEALALTWTPLGVYQGYGTNTVLNYGKGSALGVISSPNFPEEFQQGLASAVLLGRYVVSITALKADAGPMSGAKRLDVLSSTNSTFRPVDVEFGFDGALYVSDFSSLIIGHAQHAMRDPQWNHERGRIWRVVNTGRPVVTDWPRIEGASVPELLRLLTHSQNIVRNHVRIALRKVGAKVVPAIDAWMASAASASTASDQARLEASWVLAALGEIRPAWKEALSRSEDARFRAAAVQLIRLTAERWPDAVSLLSRAAGDSHPRVRMAVINAVSHLRVTEPKYEAVLGSLLHRHPPEPAVQAMLTSLSAGTRSLRGPAVPVLEVAPSTQVRSWLPLNPALESAPDAKILTARDRRGQAADQPPRRFRTFLDVTTPQPAVLRVKHGFLDLAVNGVQVLTADNQFSPQQQVTFALAPGLNAIELTYRRLRGEPPPVFVFDPLGQPLAGVRVAEGADGLAELAGRWAKAHAADAGALRVQAVPNQMQFAPRELRVQAGQPVRLIFENPDLMPHNLLLVMPGAAEAVGLLADELASDPSGLAKAYVPASPHVLQATPLVPPNERAELVFTAPSEPGRYPYLCTFPGHWRIMQGVMIVEARGSE